MQNLKLEPSPITYTKQPLYQNMVCVNLYSIFPVIGTDLISFNSFSISLLFSFSYVWVLCQTLPTNYRNHIQKNNGFCLWCFQLSVFLWYIFRWHVGHEGVSKETYDFRKNKCLIILINSILIIYFGFCTYRNLQKEKFLQHWKASCKVNYAGMFALLHSFMATYQNIIMDRNIKKIYQGCVKTYIEQFNNSKVNVPENQNPESLKK